MKETKKRLENVSNCSLFRRVITSENELAAGGTKIIDILRQ